MKDTTQVLTDLKRDNLKRDEGKKRKMQKITAFLGKKRENCNAHNYKKGYTLQNRVTTKRKNAIQNNLFNRSLARRLKRYVMVLK